MEIWKSIAETIYEVSDMGRVRRPEKSIICGATWNATQVVHFKEEILQEERDSKGHLVVYINGQQYKVSRLVADAFIPNPDNEKTLRFKNSNKTDCRAVNLSRGRTGGTSYNPAIKLIDFTTGEVYPSVMAAATAKGYKFGTLYKAIIGQRKNNTVFRVLE